MTWRAAPRTDLPEAGIATDIRPAGVKATLEGFEESLFGLSHHLESQIKHRGVRGGLMERAHEALGDGWAQAKLATDRVDAFIGEGAGGTVAKLGRALHALRRRVGV